MIRVTIYAFIALVVVHWLTGGLDNITHPAPAYSNINLEDTK